MDHFRGNVHEEADEPERDHAGGNVPPAREVLGLRLMRHRPKCPVLISRAYVRAKSERHGRANAPPPA